MTSTLFLRIASVLTFIHAVMHTAGGVFGKPSAGVAAMVDATMRANQFPAFGMMRSYFEFYRGMGLGVTIFLVVLAVVMWQIGTLAKSDGQRLRPMMVVLMLGFVAFAIDSILYFFVLPVVVEFLIAACMAAAIVAVRSNQAVEAYPKS